jgi:hypothetical protein
MFLVFMVVFKGALLLLVMMMVILPGIPTFVTVSVMLLVMPLFLLLVVTLLPTVDTILPPLAWSCLLLPVLSLVIQMAWSSMTCFQPPT